MEFDVYRVDTDIRNMALGGAPTNRSRWRTPSTPMGKFLVEDDKYKVVGFDLEYIDSCVEHDQKKDSLVDLAVSIICPYCRDRKVECNKEKPAWHKARVKRLDEDHLKHAVKDAYTCYEMY
ncbi:hypothetical protein D1007_26868 [Hordeum vulgare]|nr:hypothetical protein D1007_26868 [Hordeum vulgare]